MFHTTHIKNINKNYLIFFGGLNSSIQEWNITSDNIECNIERIFRDKYNTVVFNFDENIIDFDIMDICNNIKNILNDINVYDKNKKKIIIVGHSLGGLLAILYYKKYKKYIKGLILIDSTNPTSEKYIKNKKNGKQIIEYINTYKNLGNIKTISHINLTINNMETIRRKLIYYKYLSSHNESNLIVYPNSGHNLHHTHYKSIINSIKNIIL